MIATPGRLRPIATGIALALIALSGCGTQADADKKKEEAPVTEGTVERPYMYFKLHIPTTVAKDLPFLLIYLGASAKGGAEFSYTVPQPGPDGKPTSGFSIDVGESYTAAGYTFRLLSFDENGAQVAVTDPSGKRIGY